ncbi:aquaporin Z [Candidatus Thiodictyon syntrophicum]|uniref:Aquaporin Z n=1 Tax=Candidatus Thiodictyon syntrophicum TaxID=1166950 RepID=A0A2K8UE97_9GAMM|nr:aquaporin Z [Candidatus Thiodictyon syntrophicum]AUB83769.1 aquaporin Z [Candidatus Thiodictyon syntrophicum]
MSLMSRSMAELIGTFWLVLGGCGSAALAAVFMAGPNDIGIGLLGVALAFGLTVLTMAYAIGHISGCHLNPAVTVGLVVGGRFPAGDAPLYIIFQTIGAILAAFLLLLILQGNPEFVLKANSLAVNGFGDLSPGKYGMTTGLIVEVVMTAMFLFIILGCTDKRGIGTHAGLAIGLALTLIHLISIPVTNTSVNPARSTGPALVLALNGQGLALSQLWLFWAAPIIGAGIAGGIYRLFEAPASK